MGTAESKRPMSPNAQPVHSDDDLVQVCRRTLEVNLGLKRGEKLAVLFDGPTREIAEAFLCAGRKLTGPVEALEVDSPKFNGEEPLPVVGERMAGVEVAVLALARSLSWTRARMTATERGARVASMPGITRDILLRTMTADYTVIRDRVNRLCDRLDAARQVRVVTTLGTDLTFSVEGRQAHGRKGGIYTTPGAWGNLPCGEAFLAPVEGTAQGQYVVDASHAGVGRLTEPILIMVEQGRARHFEGGTQAAVLQKILDGIGDPKAFTMAEFGIGCNDRAQVIGTILEDEKSLGTCHFALGRNSQFGGLTDVGIHLDGVLRSPTIFLDGELLLDFAPALTRDPLLW